MRRESLGESGTRFGARALGTAVTAVMAMVGVAEAASTGPLQVAMMQGAQNCVALTFDDGPDASLTPQLLTILETKGVKATFFVVGVRAATWPAPVARAAADGFEIGNHSWDHAALPSLGTDAALSEIARTDAIIQKITGKAPAYLRAPYGSISPRIAGLTERQFIAWSVDSLDWKGASPTQMINRVVGNLTNGGIVLMHDIHANTIAAVPGIIDGLQARGFRFVTVSEMMSGSCGGSAIAYSLPGQAAPAPAAPPPVAAVAPKVVQPTVVQPAAKPTAAVQPVAKPGQVVQALAIPATPMQPISTRRYKLNDDDE